ncbi:hypothetical protein FPZ43_11245 [Mucilaginibacter pallidiroseus]|uniref:Uncharacterized protein n=1 Tax=Mucilaginibacter pallidiroseus TaxID=2599295 RepID=A0A563UBT6_9SPHI|nr:hypothetical protein [Mucilaginibacter pallidiroseus]TWR28838.1 hypothetical protein FPZ43_11245 [Mucilaginibacter pallidiroseus]
MLKCSPYDAFGNDNIAKIKIMLDVIRLKRSIAWINSAYLTDEELLMNSPDNVLWQSAMDARSWMDGDTSLQDLLFPSNVQYAKRTITN